MNSRRRYERMEARKAMRAINEARFKEELAKRERLAGKREAA